MHILELWLIVLRWFSVDLADVVVGVVETRQQ